MLGETLEASRWVLQEGVKAEGAHAVGRAGEQSRPEIQRNPWWSAINVALWAAPVIFRQTEQWQIWTPSRYPESSKRTRPQRHSPRIISALLPKSVRLSVSSPRAPCSPQRPSHRVREALGIRNSFGPRTRTPGRTNPGTEQTRRARWATGSPKPRIGTDRWQSPSVSPKGARDCRPEPRRRVAGARCETASDSYMNSSGSPVEMGCVGSALCMQRYRAVLVRRARGNASGHLGLLRVGTTLRGNRSASWSCWSRRSGAPRLQDHRFWGVGGRIGGQNWTSGSWVGSRVTSSRAMRCMGCECSAMNLRTARFWSLQGAQ